MGKGSTRRPLLISEKEVENNWDKIFGKKEKFNRKNIKPEIFTIPKEKHVHTMLPKYELDDGQLTDEQYKKIKDYECELNKSTGEVEKRFLDGISKPNESQFDGN